MSGADDEEERVLLLAAYEKHTAFQLACAPILKRNPHLLDDIMRVMKHTYDDAVEAYDEKQATPNPIIFDRNKFVRNAKSPEKAGPLVPSSGITKDDSATKVTFAFTTLAILICRGTESTGRRYLFDTFKMMGIATGKFQAFSQRVSRLGAVEHGVPYIKWESNAKDAHITVTAAGLTHYLAMLTCHPNTKMTKELRQPLTQVLGQYLPDLNFDESDTKRYEVLIKAFEPSTTDGDEPGADVIRTR